MRLIDADVLYRHLQDAEELARNRVLDTESSLPVPTNLNPSYLRYLTQLDERTRLKHIVADAPIINPQSQWIPTAKKHPPKRKNIWITDVYGDVEVVYRGDGKLWLSNGDNGYIEDEIIAWMPADIPEPYNE